MFLHEYKCFQKKCEHELSVALDALKNTYAHNTGLMPMPISTLLQSFGVDGALSDRLTSTPQMANIERSVFKAKKELGAHINYLESQIAQMKSDGVNSDAHEVLFGQLENIYDKLSPDKLGKLHRDGGKNVTDLLKGITDARDNPLAQSIVVSSQSAASDRGVFFRFNPMRGLGRTLSYLSGAIKFSSKTNKL